MKRVVKNFIIGFFCYSSLFQPAIVSAAETSGTLQTADTTQTSEETTSDSSINNIDTSMVQINESNFIDKNFRNFISEKIDKNSDGLLTVDELSVGELDLSNLDIETLKGISFFTKLEKLTLSNNKLRELNVSNLKNLKKLDISYNEISYIDLSKNSLLTEFNGSHQTIEKTAQQINNNWIVDVSDMNIPESQLTLQSNEWIYLNDEKKFSSSEKNSNLEMSISLEDDFKLQVVIDVTYPQSETTIPKVEYRDLEMNVGETKDILDILGNDIVTKNGQWVSQDPSVASIKMNQLSALKVGETSINYITETGNTLISIQLRVIAPELSKQSVQAVPIIEYQSYIQGIGWQATVSNGGISGTEGKALRVEGLRIFGDRDSKSSPDISYRSHVQDYGWETKWSTNGDVSGVPGSEKRIEAVQIKSETRDIYYRVHVQNIGWLGWAKNGESAGTTGMAYRVEAIEITYDKPADDDKQAFIEVETPNIQYSTFSQSSWGPSVQNGDISGTTGKSIAVKGLQAKLELKNITGGISYRTHVQNLGWQKSIVSGISGDSSKRLNIEAVEFKLTGEISKFCDIYYRVHSANIGWLGWAKNGESAGTSGFSYAVEAIQIKVVKKTQKITQTESAFLSKSNLKIPTINYQVHSQNLGWLPNQSSGGIAGTTGKGLRVEGLKINISQQQLSGSLKYRSHVQDIGWQNYVSGNELSGTQGQRKRVEAINIELTGELSKYFDIYYRTHIETYGWLDWAANGQPAGSTSIAKRVEAIQICIQKKGTTPPGETKQSFIEKKDYLMVMGHGGIDPGAMGNGTSERSFTRNELLPYLQKYASKLKVSRVKFYDISKDMYTETRNNRGAYLIDKSICSVTEVHLDSGGPTATGGHVIVNYQGNTPVNRALSQTIKNHVGLWAGVSASNGLSYREDLLNLRIFKSRSIDYRLTELGFITNTNDLTKIRRNIDSIAKNMIQNITGERL